MTTPIDPGYLLCQQNSNRFYNKFETSIGYIEYSLSDARSLLLCVSFVGIVSSLEGQSTDSDIFDKLISPNVGLSSEVVLTIASGLYRLIQLALRYSETSLKPEVCSNNNAAI